jgi:hypothetical protein
MVEIASDLHTGSDHEPLCWEINEGGNQEGKTQQDLTRRWKFREPIKDDEKDEEDEWRQEWMNRLYPCGESRLLTPLEQISLFKSFLDDIFGQKRWSPRAKRWWTKELEEERDILAEARRTAPPSSDQFKQARNWWLRAIRKAKSEFVCVYVCLKSYCIQPRSAHDKLPTPLPSDEKHQPDGENPMTFEALQKNIKTKENKSEEQKRQYNLNTYITSKNHHLVVLDNTQYPTAPI